MPNASTQCKSTRQDRRGDGYEGRACRCQAARQAGPRGQAGSGTARVIVGRRMHSSCMLWLQCAAGAPKREPPQAAPGNSAARQWPNHTETNPSRAQRATHSHRHVDKSAPGRAGFLQWTPWPRSGGVVVRPTSCRCKRDRALPIRLVPPLPTKLPRPERQKYIYC